MCDTHGNLQRAISSVLQAANITINVFDDNCKIFKAVSRNRGVEEIRYRLPRGLK